MKSFLFFLLISLGFAALPAQAEEPVYSIEKIKGDVYLFTNGDVNGVLLATKEGIVVVDPGPEALAFWLKNEITSRFGVPVRYVVYSNNNPKHFSGGPVFKETADYIVHVNATNTHENLRQTQKTATALRMGNTYELGGKKFEIFSAILVPTLGVYFSKEKVFYVADFAQVRRLPEEIFALKNIKDQIRSLSSFKWVEFKIFIPGHGKPGTYEDFQAYKEYVFKLLKQVFEAQRKGLGLEETILEVDLTEFMGWEYYEDRLERNITHSFQILEEDEAQEFYMTNGLVFPVSKANPKFPERAYRKNICGWVVVEYEVDEKGKTRNVRAIGYHPTELFKATSINAAKKYRYAPGFPGESIRTVIYYSIKGGCSAPDYDFSKFE